MRTGEGMSVVLQHKGHEEAKTESFRLIVTGFVNAYLSTTAPRAHTGTVRTMRHPCMLLATRQAATVDEPVTAHTVRIMRCSGMVPPKATVDEPATGYENKTV